MNILPYIINPYITSGVVAFVFSGAFVWAIWISRDAIANGLNKLRSRVFTRTGFFWTVILVFMAVSVLQAGTFFGITNHGDILAAALGFAVSFFLDLVTVILMQAMVEARYRGEDKQASQFLRFIGITCSTSTFANLAISLNTFDAQTMLPNAPDWVKILAPYILASFPLFVILMSIAAEKIINVRPLDSLNEEEYEADEKKRVKLLQIRNDYLMKQKDEELRTLQIRNEMLANKQLHKGKLPKSFRWFWEKPIDVAAITVSLRDIYEPQIETLKQRLEEMENQCNTEILDYDESTSEQNGEDILGNFSDDDLDTDPEISRVKVSLPEDDDDEQQPSIEIVSIDRQSRRSERNTDKLNPVNRQRSRSGNNAEAAKRIRGILKRKPYIGVSELAKKADVSKGYASKKKAEFLEMYKSETSSTQDSFIVQE